MRKLSRRSARSAGESFSAPRRRHSGNVLEKGHERCYTAFMKIILSNTAHDAYHRVLSELKGRLADGGEHVVIVPDKFTASSERGVIATLGLDAVFNVSVTSFTRLAEKTIGRRIRKCLTPQGSVLLLAKVIDENRGALRYYARAARSTGFAEEFYAALTAVRNSGVTAAQLRAAAVRAPENVKGKFEDMALIYERYLAALGDRRSDSSTRLEAFAAYLASGEVKMPAHFYVVDFYDFKSPELDILCGLASSAFSLTVGMVGGEGNPNERIYCDGAARRLLAACGGGEVVRSRERLHPAAEEISRRLFSYDPPERRTECGGKVRLIAARSRTEEINFLMREITGKVAAGARYRDFEVVLSDVDGYKAELKSAFLRSGIPFFIDTREMLSEQTKTRFLLSALASVRSGLRLAEVAEFVKNPLFNYGVEDGVDAAFRFENYCLKYNADRSRLTEPFTIGSGSEIAAAESVRVRLCKALEPLVFRGSIGTEQFAERVRAFLDSFDGAWKVHTAKLTETSLYYAKCADQVDEKIDSLLDEMQDTLSAEGDVAYFERMFKAAVQTVRIALVPTWLDSVYVGGTDSRYLGGGDVYVLGANVGKLPAGADGGAVISPRDEDLLAALDVKISPTVTQRIYSELMSVTEIMKRPKGTLTVCYPEGDPAGELRPSAVIAELRGMLSEDGAPLPVRRAELPPLSELSADARRAAVRTVCPTPRACLHEVLGGLSQPAAGYLAAAELSLPEEDRNRLDVLRSRVRPTERLAADAAAEAEKASGGRTSPSRLESYFTCPYMQYFSYVLRLRERKKAEPESKDYGVILHAVLEKFFGIYKENGIAAEDARKIAEEVFDECVQEDPGFSAAAAEPRVKRVLARLRREAAEVCAVLLKGAERSQYKPVYVEQYIGGGEIPALTVSARGQSVELRGRIDRVDMSDGKFFVVDYKTYKSADFTLSDIYTGRKIQLYLYLSAIAAAKGWKPVGAFYLPVSYDFSQEEWTLCYRGNMTDDIAEARRIEPLLDSDGSLYRGADGKGKYAPPHFVSDGDFDSIAAYVRRLAGGGAADIAEGRILAEPLKGACKRCDYVSACAWSGTLKGLSPQGGVKVTDFADDLVCPRRKLCPENSESEDEE